MSEQSLATWLWWTQFVGIFAAVVTAACAAGQWHLGGRLEQIRSEEARTLRNRFQDEIGAPWQPLTPEAREELKAIAVDMLPLASSAPPKMRVMFQTEGGKELAEGIAEAFRRANWQVECIRGSGFGPKIIVAAGRLGVALAGPLKRITGAKDIESWYVENNFPVDFIGIGINQM